MLNSVTVALVLLLAVLGALAVSGFASAHGVTNTRITSGPSGTIFAASATFTFDLPAGYDEDEDADFQCRLDSTRAGDWSSCTSPQTYSALADGPHTFEVRALNRPGHADPTPATATFTVASQPPQTTITSAPSGTIATGSAVFTFGSSQEGGFECRLDTQEEAAWAPCASPQAYSALGQGQHTFEVRAVNDGGNADPTPAATSFAVDTVAPQTTIVAGPSGTIGSRDAGFEFTASEPAGFECRLDSSDAGAWSPCTSPRSYSALTDGPHRFEVRATDAVGNVEGSSAVDEFTVYTGPPKPVAGQTFNLELVAGTVDLQCPGESQYSPLTDFEQVPMGCLINTRQGTVDLTASKGSSGELQGAHFWGGVFVVTQDAGDNQAVDLELAGKRMCERRGGARRRAATVSRAKSGGGRKLWGSGKGNYTTSGSYGSATVRGTTWLVLDRCDASTLFQVAEGTVWVRDFVKNRTVVLEAGQEYLAKAAIPRLDPGVWH